jgi:hypothetical protein
MQLWMRVYAEGIPMLSYQVAKDTGSMTIFLILFIYDILPPFQFMLPIVFAQSQILLSFKYLEKSIDFYNLKSMLLESSRNIISYYI